tara:strand:+ start:446 stop:850 length:405 start_codon:yes stop_codon:yes gene_type:complete
MKKLPNSWKILDKIILNILSSDLRIQDNSINIVLSCNFENIVKGRCNLIIHEKKKQEEDQVLVFSDKPLMEVKVFYELKKIEKIASYIKFSSSRKKKITIHISEGLALNNKGYLYVEERTKINVLKIEWLIPLF